VTFDQATTGKDTLLASTLLRAMRSDGAGHRGAAGKSRLRSPPASVRLPGCAGCPLFEGVVNAVLMVIAHVITHQAEQMSFVQRDDMVQDLSATTSNPVGPNYSSGSAVITKQAAEAFSTADRPASCKWSGCGEEQRVRFALVVAFRMKMGDELGHGSVE